MTRDDIYNATTKLLFGYSMDVNLFYSFLDIAQDQVEGMRPWMILRAEDSSQSVSVGNTFTTPFTIAPTNNNFKKWYSDFPVQLITAQNSPIGFKEIPISQRFAYAQTSGVYYCDYAQNKIYLCGTITQPYTLYEFYIKKSTQISAASSNTWVFDSFGYSYSALLSYLCALQWKGVDYDLINLQNSGELGKTAASILDTMTRWDADLQAQGQTGLDPFGNGMWIGNSGGGRIGL